MAKRPVHNKPAQPGGFSLEERLINNAVDTVVINIDRYEPPVLIHLIQEVAARADLTPGIHRVLSMALSESEMKAQGLRGGMMGVGDDDMNFLTMPKLHRTLLRGVQQMLEKLLPGGHLLTNKDIDHADATRMFRDCTSQLEKVLRLTKATRANAELARLKEAFGEGLTAILQEMGPEQGKQAYEIMKAAIDKSMVRSEAALVEEMRDAEEAN